MRTELSTQSPDTRPAAVDTRDWSGWERWLRGHLNIELNTLHRALGQLLATERQKFNDRLERKTSEFEVKLAKLSGSVDILRGAAPLPPAKFPTVKVWHEDTVYHAGDIVSFAGGTYQAQRDTARTPGAKDWVCLAASGETIVGPSGGSLTIRGTYNGDGAYKHLDVVMVNGSSFVALKDNPGPCPGPAVRQKKSRHGEVGGGIRQPHGSQKESSRSQNRGKVRGHDR